MRNDLSELTGFNEQRQRDCYKSYDRGSGAVRADAIGVFLSSLD